MLEVILAWIVVYIFLGFVFWEWVEYGNKNEPHTWGHRLLMAIMWLPVLIITTCDIVREWLKEDGGNI